MFRDAQISLPRRPNQADGYLLLCMCSARRTAFLFTPSTAARSSARGQALARARLALGDGPADPRGDLIMKRRRA
jgi:hypothetical protein